MHPLPGKVAQTIGSGLMAEWGDDQTGER